MRAPTRAPLLLMLVAACTSRVETPRLKPLPHGWPTAGTFVLEFRDATPDASGRRHLLSLSASRGLFDDGATSGLFVGASTADGKETTSPIYAVRGGSIDFAAPALLATNMPRGAAVADLDGDGHDDLVLSNMLANEVRIWRGPLAAGHERQADATLPMEQPEGLALVDLDGDGDLDLIVGSYKTSRAPLRSFENDGHGHFTPSELGFESETAAGVEAIAVGDVNRDGIADLLVATLSEAPSVVILGRRDEQGHYRAGQVELLDDFALGASLGDVDGDGWLDAVLARPLHRGAAAGDGEIVIHRNRGGGRFESAPDLALATTRPFTVAADRDVNEDGHVDLIVANWRRGKNATNESHVLLGPTFTETLPFPVADAVSFTFGDVDGDGLPDLFFRSSSGSSSPLFLLDAVGKPRATIEIATTATLRHVGGEGAAVLGDVAHGTTPYSCNAFDRRDSLALVLEPDPDAAGSQRLSFVVVDSASRAHVAAIQLARAATDRGAAHSMTARVAWNFARGELSLDVGSVHAPSTPKVAPIRFSTAAALMRIGAGFENQEPARGVTIEQFELRPAQ